MLGVGKALDMVVKAVRNKSRGIQSMPATTLKRYSQNNKIPSAREWSRLEQRIKRTWGPGATLYGAYNTVLWGRDLTSRVTRMMRNR